MEKLNVLILVILGVFGFSLQSYGAAFGKSNSLDFNSSYEHIDNKIVEAFNTSPPRTKEVYHYCNELINKVKDRSSRKNQKWVDKAQKLITLACYNEVLNSINDGEIKDAYMWAERGLTKGASRGRISDYEISEYYTLLEEMKIQLKSQMDEEGISYSKNRLKIDVNNTSSVKTRSERFNWQSNKRKRKLEEKRYTYIKGPLNDNFNNIYVIVKTPIQGMVRIQFYDNQGWGTPLPGNNLPLKFYKSWQECAADL